MYIYMYILQCILLSFCLSLSSPSIYILSSPFIYILSSPFIYSPLPSYIYSPLPPSTPSLSQIYIKRWSVMVRIEPSTYGNYFNKKIITFYFSSLHPPSLSLSLFFSLLSFSSLSLPPNKDTFKWFAKVSGCGQYHYNHALL